jgi:hypothetical protein
MPRQPYRLVPCSTTKAPTEGNTRNPLHRPNPEVPPLPLSELRGAVNSNPACCLLAAPPTYLPAAPSRPTACGSVAAASAECCGVVVHERGPAAVTSCRHGCCLAHASHTLVTGSASSHAQVLPCSLAARPSLITSALPTNIAHCLTTAAKLHPWSTPVPTTGPNAVVWMPQHLQQRRHQLSAPSLHAGSTSEVAPHPANTSRQHTQQGTRQSRVSTCSHAG